jgi:hypothetical protein
MGELDVLLYKTEHSFGKRLGRGLLGCVAKTAPRAFIEVVKRRWMIAAIDVIRTRKAIRLHDFPVENEMNQNCRYPMAPAFSPASGIASSLPLRSVVAQAGETLQKYSEDLKGLFIVRVRGSVGRAIIPGQVIPPRR